MAHTDFALLSYGETKQYTELNRGAFVINEVGGVPSYITDIESRLRELIDKKLDHQEMDGAGAIERWEKTYRRNDDPWKEALTRVFPANLPVSPDIPRDTRHIVFFKGDGQKVKEAIAKYIRGLLDREGDVSSSNSVKLVESMKVMKQFDHEKPPINRKSGEALLTGRTFFGDVDCCLILEFPSKELLNAFYEDEEFAAVKNQVIIELLPDHLIKIGPSSKGFENECTRAVLSRIDFEEDMDVDIAVATERAVRFGGTSSR